MDFGNCKNWFSVVSYSIVVNNRIFTSQNSDISEALEQAVQKAKIGSKFQIKKIKCSGPDGVIRTWDVIEVEIKP